MIKYLIKSVDDIADLDEFYNRLPHYLRERYQLKDKFKKESIAALTLLKELDKNFDYENLQYTKEGKPFLINNQYYLSISHSHNLVAAVISSTPVGIDIEANQQRDYDKIRKFLSDEINKLIHNQEDFFTYWTRLESFGKLLGTGIFKTELNLFNDCIKYQNKNYYFKSLINQTYYLSLVSTNNFNF